MPIFIQHGDADGAVNVDWSRWGVKLLQRWGYDVRYREYPGRVHETLQHSNGNMSIEWFLQHERNPDPRNVRIRSAELRHAKAYWVSVDEPASPLDFMRVDAEVVDRNVIRLDTENVLAVTLSPAKALIDPAEPIKVVWNGVARISNLDGGVLRLAQPAYQPASLRKSAQLPGGSNDFFVTPFAVVIGTTSKDAAMKELCQLKAQAFVDGWREEQKQPVRVFRDTEISDAEIAKYSLLLFGGADANLVTAKLSRQLPLRVTRDAVNIDGKQIRTKDSVVQMLYPNPRNHDRYVWVIAGQSANGLYNADVDLYRQYEWDYLVSDGLIPAHKAQVSPLALRVTQGMFDYNWKYAGALEVPGDAQVRAQGRPMPRPDPSIRIAPGLLASYAGKYQIDKGPVIEVLNRNNRLAVIVEGTEAELVPTGQASFLVPRFNVRVDFTRDAAGKVTGVTGYGGNDFEGRKLE